MNELAARLLAAGPRWTVRVLTDMYEDPFWAERFGERGRAQAGRDGGFHIQYLVEAVDADDVAVFERYARWLREVLVSRGMCSRHLADNFLRLAALVDAEDWPDRGRASDVLRAGTRALVYTEGDAGALDAAREGLAAAVAASIQGVRAVDVEQHLSFLADAVAFGRGELFAGYVGFLIDQARRRRRDPAPLAATFEQLAASVSALGTGAVVDGLLADARRAVTS